MSIRARAWAALLLPPVTWFVFEQGLSALLHARCARWDIGLGWGLASLAVCGVGLRVDLTTVDLASGFTTDAVLVDVPTGDPQLVLSVAMLGSDPVTVEVVSEPVAGREDAR